MLTHNWTCLLTLALVTACSGPSYDDPEDSGTVADTDTVNAADTDSATDSADTGCTPEGEPLVGEARLVCAPGTLEEAGACTASEAPSVRVTMTCASYASSGSQTLEQESSTCTVDLGAECCACSFDLDSTCDPCEVND